MLFEVDKYYRYLHLKFKVLNVDGDDLDIRIIGNIVRDCDICITADRDFHKNTIPLTALEPVVEGYYKRFLRV